MWAASGRKIRMITVPGSCLVVLSGHWCVMAWAVPKAAARPHEGACNVIEQVFQEQYAQCGAGQEGAFLKKALISANRYVFNKAAHEESLAGMGTTAVCALVRGRGSHPLPRGRFPRLPLPGR